MIILHSARHVFPVYNLYSGGYIQWRVPSERRSAGKVQMSRLSIELKLADVQASSEGGGPTSSSSSSHTAVQRRSYEMPPIVGRG